MNSRSHVVFVQTPVLYVKACAAVGSTEVNSAPVWGQYIISAFLNTKCSCCFSVCAKQVIGKDPSYPTAALQQAEATPAHRSAAAAAAYHSAALPGRITNKLIAVACGDFLLSPDTMRFGHTLSALIQYAG